MGTSESKFEFRKTARHEFTCMRNEAFFDPHGRYVCICDVKGPGPFDKEKRSFRIFNAVGEQLHAVEKLPQLTGFSFRPGPPGHPEQEAAGGAEEGLPHQVRQEGQGGDKQRCDCTAGRNQGAQGQTDQRVLVDLLPAPAQEVRGRYGLVLAELPRACGSVRARAREGRPLVRLLRAGQRAQNGAVTNLIILMPR